MPSHCRPGAALGPVKLPPFCFVKGSTIQHSVFDMHRAFQVDSCISTFYPVKDDHSPGTLLPSSPLRNPQMNNCNRAGHHHLPVEHVDVETILQLGELQDWTWPAPVEVQEVKPSNLSELSLPFASQSLQVSSTILQPSIGSMHDDQKDCTSSLFRPTATENCRSHHQQSFNPQSWCSGMRNGHSPNVAIPKFLPASGGFTTSAEPSPTTDTSPLRLDARDIKCSTATTPLSHRRSYPCSSELQTEKALGVQKKWQGKRAVSQRESHIWSERQRRKGMNHLFSTLRSLLPQPTSKTDKSTVVSEIIKYIQGLQLKLDELHQRRADILGRRPVDMTMSRMGSNLNCNSSSSMVHSDLAVASMSSSLTNEACLQSFVMPNVALHISGNNAFITMSSMKKKGIFSQILMIMQSHKLDVVNANISTSNGTVFHCLHILSSPPSCDFPKEALQTALQNLALTDRASSNCF